MKTLLVLAQSPDFAEAVRAAVNPESYRIIHRNGLEEAEPLLQHGLFNLCLVDVESTEVQGMWMIEKLRRQVPSCPILVFTGSKAWGWEEEAYLKGVAHVLTKPVRARLLNGLLERSFAQAPAPAARPGLAVSTLPAMRPAESGQATLPAAQNVLQALEVVRHFSAILTHSLCAEAMLNKFLLLLREIVGVNRAAIFLREPIATFGEKAAGEPDRSLRKACAIGLPSGLLEQFELSFEAGIGGHLFRSGRILRRYSEEARVNLEMQQEFELLGAQVAVPILDRETLIGVAVFDGRVTGELVVNAELEGILQLLEEVSLEIENMWVHD